MAKDGCSSGSFSTFLTGALFGAAAALLLAPKTGKETRQILADYGAELKDSLPEDLRERADATIARGKGMVEQGQAMVKRGNEIISEGREFVDEKKKALNDAIEAGRIAMEQEKETLSETLDEEA